jgi:hypothetical protein
MRTLLLSCEPYNLDRVFDHLNHLRFETCRGRAVEASRLHIIVFAY